jgi:Fe-S cluster biogenesis protein NfuA/nitrite reductase/ring-hydroxylating ferredoxin subunit
VDDGAARELVGQVEARLEALEALPDAAAREAGTEAVAALVEMYGEGLARILARSVDGDGGLHEALAGDELVSHLLLLHDLHPIPVEARVRGALEEVRPYLESHGGDVELVAVEAGVVRLRLAGSCDGCPSSAMTLKLAIEEAIQKAAPEIERVEADGAAPEPGNGLIQLTVAGGVAKGSAAGAPPAEPPEGGWATAGALPELSNGGTLVKPVAGEQVLFLCLGETFYAYRPACPACGGSLEGAALDGDELTCPACRERYDARRAGRSLDGSGLQLVPVPLLVDDAGLVRVAVGAVAA